MSYWKIIKPEAATNKVLNPIAGTTGNFTQLAGTTVSRSSTYAFYGVYSYRIESDADNEGISLTLSTLTNAAHYITLFVRGTLPAAWDWSLNDTDYTVPTLIRAVDANWSLYGLAVSAAQATTSTALHIRQKGAGSGAFFLDGIDVVAADHWTTHVDGDEPGCEWNGTANASTSSRSAYSRAGGRVYDLLTDYKFRVSNMIGAGGAPQVLNTREFATLPGGVLVSQVRASSPFTLQGTIEGGTFPYLETYRKALKDIFSSEAYPGNQPVRILFTGGTTDKYVDAYYETGLQGNLNSLMGGFEKVNVRLWAPDPNWYELGQSSQVLDTNDTATLYYLAGRLKSTGQWDDLGLSAVPTADGNIWAVCVASNKSVYFGGNYDGINNNVPAGGDFIIRWDPTDESLNLLVGASDVNGAVTVISEGPDGKIYLGGAFTSVNGEGTADYIVAYDPVADTWSSLADPDTGTAAITQVLALAWDSAGNLYVGGDFLNFGGVANADYFAKWDGTSWTAIGSGGSGVVYAVALDSDDNIYIGGSFLNWAADDNADKWAWWNGSAWAAVDDIALGDTVHALIFSPDDVLYVGGVFANAGSVAAADRIFTWNGSAVEALGAGMNDTVYTIHIAPDGSILAGGLFTQAGDVDVSDRVALWNGSTWTHLDLNLAGTPSVFDSAMGNQDAVIPDKFDIFIGFSSTGAAYFAGDATTTNSGGVDAYPKIVIKWTAAGTAAKLLSIRNETTGKALYCDYALLLGETLTIDLDPSKLTATSSFFGLRPDAILPNSDLGQFSLKPGVNNITAFVDVTSATIVAYLLWRDPFDGLDG
jgi:hypothetical protein